MHQRCTCIAFREMKAKRHTRDDKKHKKKKKKKKKKKRKEERENEKGEVLVFVFSCGSRVYADTSAICLPEVSSNDSPTGVASETEARNRRIAQRSRSAFSSNETKWRDQTVECISQHDNCGVKPCTSDRSLSKRSFSFKLSSISYFSFCFFLSLSRLLPPIGIFNFTEELCRDSLSPTGKKIQRMKSEKERERERENPGFSLRNGTECYTADEFVQFYQQTEHQLSESWNLQPFSRTHAQTHVRIQKQKTVPSAFPPIYVNLITGQKYYVFSCRETMSLPLGQRSSFDQLRIRP